MHWVKLSVIFNTCIKCWAFVEQFCGLQVEDMIILLYDVWLRKTENKDVPDYQMTSFYRTKQRSFF